MKSYGNPILGICGGSHIIGLLLGYKKKKNQAIGLRPIEIEDEFLSALERMYPSFNRADVLHFQVSKASHVLPVTTLNYSTELVPPTKTSLENVFIINSAQIANGTMNANEIIGLANRKTVELAELLS